MHLLIQEGSLQKLPQFLEKIERKYSKVVLITDRKVFSLFPLTIEADPIFVPCGEECKSIKWAEFCWEQLAEKMCDRHTLIIGMGGGALLDLSGFVAATFMRGVDRLAIPTTMMAMCDASIGAKTAINLGSLKNLIGAIHMPVGILMDPECLTSLSKKEIHSGLAEVVKHGLLEPTLLDILEGAWTLTDLIRRSVAVKERLIADDLEDKKGIRAFLNFGHTIGHALESACDFSLLHGEAVSLGMVAEVRLGIALGLTPASILVKLKKILASLELPIVLPEISLERVWEAMQKDKKRFFGALTFPLLEDFGKIRLVQGIPKDAILHSICQKN